MALWEVAGFAALSTVDEYLAPAEFTARSARCKPPPFDAVSVDTAHNLAIVQGVEAADILSAASADAPLSDVRSKSVRGHGAFQERHKSEIVGYPERDTPRHTEHRTANRMEAASKSRINRKSRTVYCRFRKQMIRLSLLP